MNKPHRYHILFMHRFLQYGFVICLLPLLQALFAWDFARLLLALQQVALILLCVLLLAICFWWHTAFTWNGSTVELRQGLFVPRTMRITAQALSAIEMHRTLLCRILGATKLTFYFKRQTVPKHVSVYVPRHVACAVADTLLPVSLDGCVFSPTGVERLSLVMLSANIVSTCLFLAVALDRAEGIFGQDFSTLAQANATRYLALFELFFPAGVALFASLVFFLGSVAFLRALLHTAGFQVCRNGGVIISRGGLITRIERRISVQAITCCDVRITPVARLLRRRPVYVCAGSFLGNDAPLLVYHKNDTARPETLLPNFSTPSHTLCIPRKKSVVQYVWKPLCVLGFCLAVCAVALSRLPHLLPVLLVPVVWALGWFLAQLYAVLTDGMCTNDNRTTSVVCTRLFTRHEVCVLTHDVAYVWRQNPLSRNDGRCDFSVKLPSYHAYKVRGVRLSDAMQMPFYF